MTIKELKDLIKDLPDVCPVYVRERNEFHMRTPQAGVYRVGLDQDNNYQDIVEQASGTVTALVLDAV